MKRILWLLALVPTLLLADDVHLKGGAVFSGRIVDQTEASISIDLGDGVVGVPMSRVERIVKGRSPLEEYEDRARKLQARDASGWRELGRWASQQSLGKQSRQAYENVLAVAPDDPEARQALGYVLLDGRWLTEEESYRAQGYVQHEGEWMTPAEAQLAQSAAAAEQQRQEAEQRALQAQIEADEAKARAAEAEQKAKEAQEEHWGWDPPPVYWGSWGYGVTYWPTTAGVVRNPAYRPSQLPARTPR